ncbi:MAG: hypothetical protein ACI80F_002166, partial [Natronomonas sp.]
LGSNDCCATGGDGLEAAGSEYADNHAHYSMTRSEEEIDSMPVLRDLR